MKRTLEARLQMYVSRNGLGRTIVYDKTENMRPCLMTVTEKIENDGSITLMGFVADKIVGFIKVFPYQVRVTREGMWYLWNKAGHTIQSPYWKNTDEKPEEDIRVTELETTGFHKDRYTGVGTALMQAGAMELGLIADRHCRLRLVAILVLEKARQFYWNLGLRFASSADDEKFAKILVEHLKQGKKRITDFKNYPFQPESFNMHLPRSMAFEWWRRIKQDPILDETRKALKKLK